MSLHPASEKVIIINSGKCAWGGCNFCGWGRLVARKKGMHQLKEFWDEQVRDVKPGSLEYIKIFCSGCFLDPAQIEPAFRSYVVRSCEKLGVKKLVVESFPRFITDENLESMHSDKVELLAGIGLECADDEVLKKIHKGFTLKDFEESAEVLKRHGWGIRAYLLVNAPGMKSEDVKKSVDYSRKWAEEYILINCLPHYAAPIMGMWLRGEWRPLNKKEFFETVKDYDCEKDFQNFNFVPMWDSSMQERIKGATEAQLTHKHYEVWQDYICRFWEPKGAKDTLLFVPCAFRKPYSASQLHRAFMPIVSASESADKIQVCVISSPGVIPYEYANRYPFTSYDWPEWEETPEIKERYTEVTQARIENFLRAHGGRFKRVLSYLKPDSESFIALKQACDKLNIALTNSVPEEAYELVKNEKNPLAQPAALSALQATLSAGSR